MRNVHNWPPNVSNLPAYLIQRKSTLSVFYPQKEVDEGSNHESAIRSLLSFTQNFHSFNTQSWKLDLRGGSSIEVGDQILGGGPILIFVVKDKSFHLQQKLLG